MALFANYTILIIENNYLTMEMASELLQIAGFNILQAEDAMTGIKIAQEAMPDIILMDLQLPYTDGFMATRLIKADPLLKDIPVVAFTALAMPEQYDKALASGCVGVISKPIDITNFAKTVASFIPTPNKNGGAVSKNEKTMQEEDSMSEKEDELDQSNSKLQAGYYHHIDEDANVLTHNDSEISEHRILVVDDNPMNVELLMDALKSMGQNPIPAYSGEEALKKVWEVCPDLILLDIMMPNVDGYTVLKHLKSDPKTANLPVVFVSALNRTQDMVMGLKLGTYDYITKPFKIEEVKARIYAVLRIKELQDSLRNERDKLNAIFKFSTDAIALLTPDLKLVAANPLFGQWFNVTLTADGKPETAVDFMHLLECQCAYNIPCPLHTPNIQLISRAEADSKEYKEKIILQDIVIPGPDNKNRYIALHSGIVPGLHHQHIGGFVIILRDITRKKEIEQSKQNFVATLTHDLKTPIRAEYQALELLKEEHFGVLNPQQQEIIKEISQSNRYMANLVNSLLSTYMYEEGKAKIQMESIDLNLMIEKELFAPLRTLAAEKEQKFELNLDKNLPLVLADWIEIQRVLNNLVQNAISFTPNGGTITLETKIFNDQQVLVSVKDTGQGIESKNIPLLFDRYKTMAKKFHQVGTGLGLYLSRMIVEAHGGEIGVESEYGKGSCFRFTLLRADNVTDPTEAVTAETHDNIKISFNKDICLSGIK